MTLTTSTACHALHALVTAVTSCIEDCIVLVCGMINVQNAWYVTW